MRILIWHHHGSWTANFLRGNHEYLLPVTGEQGPLGLDVPPGARPGARVRELTPEQLRDEQVDVVVVQRHDEVELAREVLGRTPGKDVPAVYLEHNTPGGHVTRMRHPLADQDAIPVVHVTPFNRLFWDSGRAPTTVIEHGVADPGHQFSGDVEAAAVVVNEPIRRGRATGTDLLPGFATAVELDVFGMGVTGLAAHLGVAPARLREHEDVPRSEMLRAIARRRVYVHPNRWTSLGLSLIEAMLVGLPAVVVGTTEAYESIPTGGGVVSTRVDRLVRAARSYAADPDHARAAGAVARAYALERFGVDRFLDDWDRLFKEVSR